MYTNSMKKITLILVLILFASNVFADHYKKKINMEQQQLLVGVMALPELQDIALLVQMQQVFLAFHQV